MVAEYLLWEWINAAQYQKHAKIQMGNNYNINKSLDIIFIRYISPLIKGTLWSFSPLVELWRNVFISGSLFCLSLCTRLMQHTGLSMVSHYSNDLLWASKHDKQCGFQNVFFVALQRYTVCSENAIGYILIHSFPLNMLPSIDTVLYLLLIIGKNKWRWIWKEKSN